MEYTLIHTDPYGTETLIRFEFLPTDNGGTEIVVNEVSLIHDGEIIGDSPTISEAQAKDIVLASDNAEWQPFQLTPTPKYASPERCEIIRISFEGSGARFIELQQLVASSAEYDAEYKQHAAKHAVLSEAWRKVKGLWMEYYLCGHYATNKIFEEQWR